ncbi:MAG: YihY/virulence factor BrkB family protein [Thermus sp.]|uniref:YhjD/YihY/BrkB family envelope integrity protein n=1 Tax=Thermus sp. TaxID=275 RepID=UPI0025F15FB5|nr:YhjD/YihY/BrkB family envelope integrity protein [Thermus sp.]MCS7217492.1 YihY/virulence factor BrkB family protein [Thermus sp.]MCX7848837.1 YihY/virulence factor BrkB family protein [Thermus sp.]MDW8016730.1 YhjD/YihY/BrkB family envelope integrity protein [Thermus sp.]MDW8357432.1 YhjD/YihY/BrkB family envelope integrity protein [Thermus sp.]
MLRRLWALYAEAHVPFFAAALAYYALLSLTPLLLLLLGVFGLLLAGKGGLQAEFLEGVAALTQALFPARPELAQDLLRFLTRTAFPLTLASGLLLLWSGSNFFAALSYALGLIFGRPRGFRHRLLGLLMPFALGLGLILLALLGLALGFLLRYLPPEWRGLFTPLERLLPLLAAFLLFLLTYAFFRGVGRLRDLLPLSAGAGAATLLFEGVRFGLPWLLPRSPYELLYGPLAGFVLALLGLYLLLLALLLGALLARILEEEGG